MSVGRFSIDRIAVPRPGYRALVVALVAVWGLGDAASTLLALELTGSASGEANPLVRALLVTDPALVVALKAGVVVLAAGLLTRYRPVVETIPGWRLWFVSVLAVGTTIVAGNVYVGAAAAF